MSGNDLNNSSAVQAAAKALFNRSPLNLECRQELMDRKKQFITSNKELQSHLSHLDITELTDCLVWIPESELYIGKVLGRGASGLCNEAKTNLGQVAVKAMKVQELMILAHVTYHGQPTEIPTLPVYGLSRKDGKYLMIMELGSCSLESKLSESAFENFDTVHAHATIIADRLRQVHILGIIHKDLNPKNLVLASSDSGALIVDFGLSTTIDDPRHEPGSYGRGEYLPPEALTAGPFTTAYDIHCLGSVMWHLLPSVPLSKKYLKVDREEVLVPSVSNDFTSREEELIPGVLKEYMNIYVDCWNPDPLKRPTIDNIIERLRKCKPQSESPTPWSKESLDFIERQQQDAEHERKSTGNSETTVESQFSPRMAPLSTTNNQTNTYTFQEPQQALPLTMTKGYKFQAAEPSASGINTNGVSAPEPVYGISPLSLSYLEVH
ncbi:kinase-like domain-containing protein [Endogone sp. FLAS-F59071]|nr:kinase-like domain-containing protein [Endogone sp. FLAS-F59071]|eukprot:RUS14152.1 kinase-like domain-containing protein [Endogone sp. FLAS-F59071]